MSAAGFGSMVIFAKLAYAAGMNLPSLLAGRFSLAALLLWGLVLARRTAVRLPLRRVLGLLALGGVGYVGQSFAYFTAAGLIPAATVGLLLYTYPALVTLLAWLLLKDPLTWPKGLAVAAAFAGCVFVLGAAGGNHPAAPAGLAWGLAAAAIYSLYIIVGTPLTAGVPPLLASAYIVTAAAGAYLAGGALTGQLHVPAEPSGWVWMAAIAVFCTVLAIAGFIVGLAHVGPSRAAILSTLEPVVTVLLAGLVLSEPLAWSQLAGGALILSAIVILQWRRRRPAVARAG
jgi:drug/metabolite transporter (DMT)-like permease